MKYQAQTLANYTRTNKTEILGTFSIGIVL